MYPPFVSYCQHLLDPSTLCQGLSAFSKYSTPFFCWQNLWMVPYALTAPSANLVQLFMEQLPYCLLQCVSENCWAILGNINGLIIYIGQAYSAVKSIGCNVRGVVLCVCLWFCPSPSPVQGNQSFSRDGQHFFRRLGRGRRGWTLKKNNWIYSENTLGKRLVM